MSDAGIDRTSQEHVHYIQVPNPALSGWNGIFRMVRESDITKVEDCKDDIDTLLVFAGLYSAVLTAFIIESYGNLQRDPQDTMVFLMQESFNRNYTFNNGFLTPLSAAPTLPPFEAPIWAIRVNVLWFTSLVISLSAASLGMLVKQWLREYLSLEYTSVEQRLRARQYRSPALKSRKVFEIAAILPLMLQISLGLFFAGLCFFTAAIHDSIGRSTLPVVAAWLFFLILTVVAPLFSPRCPYQTTFLKTTIRAGRKVFMPLSHQPIRTLSRVAGTVSNAVLCRIYTIPFSSSRRPSTVRIPAGRSPWPEEDEIVKEEAEDADLFASLDADMMDDHLLTTLIAILPERNAVLPTTMIDFAWRVLGHRSGAVALNPETPSTLALRSHLQPRSVYRKVWVAVVKVVSDAMAQLLSDAANTAPDSMRRAAAILLYDVRYALSDMGTLALRDLFAHDRRSVHLDLTIVKDLSYLDIKLPSRTPGAHVAESLNALITRQPDAPLCPICVIAMFRASFDEQPEWNYGQFCASINARYRKHITLNILHGLLLDGDRTWNFDVEPATPSMVEDLLIFVEYHCAKLGCHDGALTIARNIIFKGPECMYNYIAAFAAYFPGQRLPERTQPMFKFTEVFCEASSSECHVLLDVACDMCRLYSAGALANKRVHPEQDFVRVCLVLLDAARAFQQRRGNADNAASQLAEKWESLWPACAQCLCEYGALVGRSKKESAAALRCLEIIWASRRDGHNVYPAALVEALEVFLAMRDVPAYHTARSRVAPSPEAQVSAPSSLSTPEAEELLSIAPPSPTGEDEQDSGSFLYYANYTPQSQRSSAGLSDVCGGRGEGGSVAGVGTGLITEGVARRRRKQVKFVGECDSGKGEDIEMIPVGARSDV